MKQFVFGGARSGKSSLAETLAAACGERIAYIATANRTHNDIEMSRRIDHHHQQRPAHWCTLESPVELASALEHAKHYDCVMVDCLTLWLCNCLQENNWAEQQQNFLNSLKNFKGNLVIVSNEVGMGIVPMGELSRNFVDESGFLHQAVAAICDRVIFTAAGLPLVLKGPPLDN